VAKHAPETATTYANSLTVAAVGATPKPPKKRVRKKRPREPMYPFEQIDAAVAHDPNNAKAIRRSHRGTRIARAMTFWPFWICPMIGFLLTLQAGASIGMTLASVMLGFVVAMFFGSIGINLTIAMDLGKYDRRTLALPSGMDPTVVERLIDALVEAARSGLEPQNRPALQRMLDESDAVITAMTGTRPSGMVGPNDALAPAESMEARARDLEHNAPRVIDRLRARGGAKYHEFVVFLCPVIRTIATMAVDLGLDPAGFAPDGDAIPHWQAADTGTVDESTPYADALTPIVESGDEADAGSPAQKVRRLGRVWINGPRLIDETMAMDADAACGHDVDDIESRWRMARRHAVAADVEQIDRDFSESCEILCTRLETAIALRSAMLRDELTNGRRYIESKHARD